MGETVFQFNLASGSGSASGGGVSQFFTRPSWQTDGGSILTNANRCVPDVSMVWQATIQGGFGTPALVVLNGSDVALGGTSLSVQVWGGIMALINQARAFAGNNPVGLLGPVLYPLHGTSAFNDITSGNNGFYFAGPGYDLCTGLGSPNIANLASTLGTVPSNPGTVTTNTPPPPPASGGGGGGAPSYWFYLALTILLAIRGKRARTVHFPF